MARLLVVDDEWLIRKGIVQMVKRLKPDWSVEEANNGKQAVEMIKESAIDLVFSDIKMPGIGGMEMLEILNKQGFRIPVVFLTGYDEFQLMRSAIQLKAYDYLLKPVNDDDMIAVLANFERDYMNPFPGDGKIIQLAKAYIDKHLQSSLTLTEVANHVHFNPTYFSEYFKDKCGETFSQYVLRIKMEKAKTMLEDPANRIIDISDDLGYKNPRSFTKMFKIMTGMTPKEYRDLQM